LQNLIDPDTNDLFLRRTLGRTFLGFSGGFSGQQAGGFRVFGKELAKLGDVDFSVGRFDAGWRQFQSLGQV
jgi:hypothetical protein